jgi:hypothetical protein
MLRRGKILITVVCSLIVICGAFCVWQFVTLQKAHSTFENYYAFRGCSQLLERGTDYGVCKTSSGQTEKIVLYHGRWYLDGDLPELGFL